MNFACRLTHPERAPDEPARQRQDSVTSILRRSLAGFRPSGHRVMILWPHPEVQVLRATHPSYSIYPSQTRNQNRTHQNRLYKPGNISAYPYRKARPSDANVRRDKSARQRRRSLKYWRPLFTPSKPPLLRGRLNINNGPSKATHPAAFLLVIIIIIESIWFRL